MRVGMMILPPSVTGARSTRDWGVKKCRPDRVYITTSDKAALVFAAMHPTDNGTVYEVEPIGEVVADPDCDPTTEFESFECERARIVKVRRVYPSVRDDIRRHFVKGAGEKIKEAKRAMEASKGEQTP